jgi:hypothetical protein
MQKDAENERVGAKCSRKKMNRGEDVRRSERGKREVGFDFIEEDDEATPLDGENRRS